MVWETETGTPEGGDGGPGTSASVGSWLQMKFSDFLGMRPEDLGLQMQILTLMQDKHTDVLLQNYSHVSTSLILRISPWGIFTVPNHHSLSPTPLGTTSS